MLTDNLQVVRLRDHGLSVDLAHISARVARPGVTQRQGPSLRVATGYGHAVVLRDHVRPDCQDRLGVHSQPRHLG